MPIIGHSRQIAYFNKVISRGRLAHAYLFYGPEHVGKFTVAEHFVKNLPCSHPIILDVENTLVSKKEKRKDIPIGDIRELKRLFSLTPPEGEWRIAIINQAEKLSPEAADAFLKLLEEPGSQTLFILVSHGKELLPPTIISRLAPIRFSTLPDDLLLKFLEPRVSDDKTRREMVFLASGRPGLLWRFVEDSVFFQNERKTAREIGELLRTGLIPLALEISEHVSYNEEERSRVIEYVMRWYRRGLMSGATGFGPATLKKINFIATVLSTTNVNPRLALDALLLQAVSRDKA